MRLGNRSTDTLAHVTTNICKNDKQVDIVRTVLEKTLSLYQWHYQTATDNQQYRNAKSGASKSVAETIELLRNSGQDALADEVEVALHNNDATSTLTRKKVLSQAKKHMKELLLDSGLPVGEYNKYYAKHLEKAFIEWCEIYPLDEAPEHFDNSFEPPFV